MNEPIELVYVYIIYIYIYIGLWNNSIGYYLPGLPRGICVDHFAADTGHTSYNISTIVK